MKLPLVFFSAFAVLTLCLPLVAVGGTPALLPVQPVQTQQQKSPSQPAAPPASVPAKTAGAQPNQPAAAPQTQGAPVKAADTLRILNLATNRVQEVSRADYVRGAVCAEMPPDFHTEALTAQAVAANTYALRCQLNQQRNPDPALKGADFSANPDNWEGYVTEQQARERFGDQFDIYWGKLSQAADNGAKYVLLYAEEPIVAAYHSISAGQTEYAGNVWEGGVPYLVPVESFGDTLAPGYETSVQFSAQELEERLRKVSPDIQLGEDPMSWIRVRSRSDSGYALEVMVGDQTLSGKELRSALGLRSADFDIDCQNGIFTFTVRGYGHGVGLSQYGADYMARQGSAFEEILSHYYSDCELRLVQ